MDPVPERHLAAIRDHVATVNREKGSHGLDHVLRVTRLCERIGEEEGADPAILIPASLFHDIARPRERETGVSHEEEGARVAEAYLRGIGYNAEKIPAIAAAIRTHRYRSEERPGTLEAKILSDADKLDAMGATGIARTFLRSGEHSGEIRDGREHIDEKLLKLKDRLYTRAAKRIAEERHEFLQIFAETLDRETGGITGNH